MLNTPADFPNAGCHAVIVNPDPGATAAAAFLPVSVVRFSAGRGTADVLILGAMGASAHRTIPASDLQDATPLSQKEREELSDLDSTARGKRLSRAKTRRHDDLVARAERAPYLARGIRAAETLKRADKRAAPHEEMIAA